LTEIKFFEENRRWLDLLAVNYLFLTFVFSIEALAGIRLIFFYEIPKHNFFLLLKVHNLFVVKVF
jgi:hypothetical protein